MNEPRLKSPPIPPAEVIDPRPSLRRWGVLPLIFFLAHAFYYWRMGTPAHILWLCNIGNLLLAAGLFFNLSVLIRIAVIWLIPGLVLWVYFIVLTGGWLLTSGFAHIGGLTVGLLTLAKVGIKAHTWLYAFGWYLLVQQVSRLLTPPALNVNVAHHIYQGWEQSFSSYGKFWLLMTLVVAAGLWLLNLILLQLWPAGGRKGAEGQESRGEMGSK